MARTTVIGNHRIERFLFTLVGVVLTIFINIKSVKADLIRESYRAADLQAMGNAGIALMDDEHSLYMNPAGLAGVESPALHLVQIDGTVTDELLSSIEAVKTLKSPTGSELQQFFGKNLSAQARAGSSLILPGFGVGGFYQGDVGLYASNPSIPKVEFTAIRTGGVQLGVGVSSKNRFKPKRKNKNAMKREAMQSEWRLGVAGRTVHRTGRAVVLPVTSLSSLNADDIQALVRDQGSALGFDLGFQYRTPLTSSLGFFTGAAVQDLGDTSFGNLIEAQKTNVSIGTGLRFREGPLTIDFAYDMRQVTQSADWRKKQHFGLRFSLGIIELMGGLNQFYPAYGAAVDLGIIRVVAYSIKEEAGILFNQDPERRYGVRVDFKLPL